MHRRRFLTLAGAGATGAVGGAAGLRRRRIGPPAAAVADGTRADARLEQPMTPCAGSHRVIWSVETDEPLVALTFDDGPDPRFTPRVLEALAAAEVRATFFLMGWSVERHPDLARAVVDAGHEVANHSWSHLNLLQLDHDAQRQEIHGGAQAIEAVTGRRPTLFRPPRGQLTGSAIRIAAASGADTLLWSVDRGAAEESDPAVVAAHVSDSLRPGDVVLLHDGTGRGQFEPGADYAVRCERRRQVEVESLPRILDDALARGLRLGTASELLAAERARPVEV